MRDGLSVPTRLKDAASAVCGDFETDEVVGDDVIDTRIAGGEGYTVLFALDGQQARAERLGEADAALVRGGRIAGDRHDQGFRESFDVLGVGVAEGGFHAPMLTEVAGVDGPAGV
ncbi:hypothetical protein A6S26_13775 [Nostoc sp. ATCC 43529]|nr:hypothetical protein A6S26_13775 [Nostoc sp. ATCC 43529]